MNSKNIYIIVIDHGDAMILQSARGFLYKYMMRDLVEEIHVLHLDIGSKELKVGAKWSSKIRSFEEDGDLNKYYKWDLQALLAERNSSSELREAGGARQYKKQHEHAAILITHGGQGQMANATPEDVADALIELTREEKLPVFTKIVLDICHSGAVISDVPENSPFWEKERVWTAQQQEVINRGGRKAVNVQKGEKGGWNFKYDEESNKTLPVVNPVIKKEDFSLTYRFLNRYATCSGEKDILIAGYDAVLTAAHPDKKPGPQDIQSAGKKILVKTGGPVPRESKFCYLFKKSDNKISFLVDQAGWSDRL
jgi:hypothetical protein